MKGYKEAPTPVPSPFPVQETVPKIIKIESGEVPGSTESAHHDDSPVFSSLKRKMPNTQKNNNAKRVRSPKWNQKEIQTLIEEVRDNWSSLFGNGMGELVPVEKKNSSMLLIVDKVNSVNTCGVPRTRYQVERKWSDMKYTAKLKVAAYRAAVERNRGGPVTVPVPTALNLAITGIVESRKVKKNQLAAAQSRSSSRKPRLPLTDSVVLESSACEDPDAPETSNSPSPDKLTIIPVKNEALSNEPPRIPIALFFDEENNMSGQDGVRLMSNSVAGQDGTSSTSNSHSDNELNGIVNCAEAPSIEPSSPLTSSSTPTGAVREQNGGREDVGAILVDMRNLLQHFVHLMSRLVTAVEGQQSNNSAPPR